MSLIVSSTWVLLVPSGSSAAIPARSHSKNRLPNVAPPTSSIRAAPVAPVYLSPQGLIDQQAQFVLSYEKSRPLRAIDTRAEAPTVKAHAKKSEWLSAVYDRGLVEASPATRLLADKRVLFSYLNQASQGRAAKFYPKTIGLREFLSLHKLINSEGRITADGDTIEEQLHEEFPMGFVVRPAVGVAAQETSRGLFPDTDVFIAEILKPSNVYYRPEHMKLAVKSHILSEIASGEAIVLQEDVISTADAHKALRTRFFTEVRVHTYEGQVIEDGVPARWVQHERLHKEEISRAENYVREFLQALPANVLNRQAWGVDVALFDNGDLRVIDVVTNRGQKIQWSSYLEQPAVLAAYTRHFEKLGLVKFTGLSGMLLRDGWANYMPYWMKRIEKARATSESWVAYLPPSP